MPLSATQMQLEIIILSEVRQRQMYDMTYMESQKMIQMNIFTKQKQTHTENKLMVTKREGAGVN